MRYKASDVRESLFSEAGKDSIRRERPQTEGVSFKQEQGVRDLEGLCIQITSKEIKSSNSTLIWYLLWINKTKDSLFFQNIFLNINSNKRGSASDHL